MGAFQESHELGRRWLEEGWYKTRPINASTRPSLVRRNANEINGKAGLAMNMAKKTILVGNIWHVGT